MENKNRNGDGFLDNLLEFIFKAIWKPPITVEGTRSEVTFNSFRLEKHRDKVKEIVGNLNPIFKKGLSYSILCYDKNGNQWTGYRQVCEQLFVLGLATGYLAYAVPREIWKRLPGGLPYIISKLH